MGRPQRPGSTSVFQIGKPRPIFQARNSEPVVQKLGLLPLTCHLSKHWETVFKRTKGCKLQDLNTEFASESEFAKQIFFFLLLCATSDTSTKHCSGCVPCVSGYCWRDVLTGGESPHSLAMTSVLLIGYLRFYNPKCLANTLLLTPSLSAGYQYVPQTCKAL